MLFEEDLLETVFNSVDDTSAQYLAVVDESRLSFHKAAKYKTRIDKTKNLVWQEPTDGLYVVDSNVLMNFKYDFDNVGDLFQALVDCGYTLKSREFNVPEPRNLLLSVETSQIAILILFGPSTDLKYTSKFLASLETPDGKPVDVVLADNSPGNKVKKLAKKLLDSQKFKNIRYTYIPEICGDYPEENELHRGKHIHVAKIYSRVLRELVADYDYILTLEDDVSPPRDGLIRLLEHMKKLKKRNKPVFCVAGHYEQRGAPELICASRAKKVWGNTPKLDKLPKKLFRVEMQGGGFALYDAKLISQALPYNVTYKSINGCFYMTGWDGTLGETMDELGYIQYCDGNLYCKHHI